MAVVAVDLGDRRIGLAVSDGDTGAYPLATIERRSLKRDLLLIAEKIESRGVTRLVVGLPLNMDGSEGPAARRVRRFCERLAAHFALPVDLFDERLSSFEARGRLAGTGVVRNHRGAVDALAAVVILEGWLEAHREPR